MGLAMREGARHYVGVIFGMVPKSARCISWCNALVGMAHKSAQAENKSSTPDSRYLYQQH